MASSRSRTKWTRSGAGPSSLVDTWACERQRVGRSRETHLLLLFFQKPSYKAKTVTFTTESGSYSWEIRGGVIRGLARLTTFALNRRRSPKPCLKSRQVFHDQA